MHVSCVKPQITVGSREGALGMACWLQGCGILSPALGPGYFVLRASYKMHTSGTNRRVPLLAQQLSHPPLCSQLTKGLSEAWGGQRPREAASSGSGEE